MQEALVQPQVLNRQGRGSQIAALTLDLDDTLWPILPVIERCEQALHDFLTRHAPEVARRYPVPGMRELRDRIAADRPDLAHDYGRLRRLSLEHGFAQAGLDAPELVDQAYTLFYATRNQVELYDDVVDALPRLAARHRLLALTNGNADLAAIGLDVHFEGFVSASAVGCAKPDRRIFDHACAVLDLPAERIWHVGDDPHLDALGARAAGMRTVWLDRARSGWCADFGPAPDLIVNDLHQLLAWLDGDP